MGIIDSLKMKKVYNLIKYTLLFFILLFIFIETDLEYFKDKSKKMKNQIEIAYNHNWKKVSKYDIEQKIKYDNDKEDERDARIKFEENSFVLKELDYKKEVDEIKETSKENYINEYKDDDDGISYTMVSKFAKINKYKIRGY